MKFIVYTILALCISAALMEVFIIVGSSAERAVGAHSQILDSGAEFLSDKEKDVLLDKNVWENFFSRQMLMIVICIVLMLLVAALFFRHSLYALTAATVFSLILSITVFSRTQIMTIGITKFIDINTVVIPVYLDVGNYYFFFFKSLQFLSFFAVAALPLFLFYEVIRTIKVRNDS